MRSSSPEVALVTVSRPRLRCSPLRVGRGVGTTTFCRRERTSAGRRTTRALFVCAGGAAARWASAPATAAPGAAGPTRRDRWGRRRFAAGKAAARFLLRLALEIGFLGAAQLLVALARFGGLAFDAVARLALAPSLGVRLLTAAVLLLLGARVDERAGARLALLGGQRGQDDAGLGRRRSAAWRARRAGAPRRRARA